MKLPFHSLITSMLAFGAAHAASVTDATISEFLASNDENLLDEDGNSSDWIEIQNTSNVSGDFGGWFLTDDPDNLSMWPIPATEIESGGYLVIFASGENRNTSPHHTNFRLQSSPGGYLALVRPDGTIASEFLDIPEQRTDISFGDGFFLTPTPGAANVGSFAGFVADTSFSVDRGFYEAPIQVEITSNTEGASIRYTSDGSPPSSTQGTLYTGPITVDETTVIRAMAFRAGFQPTNIDTHTYIFPESVISQSRMRTVITQSPTFAPQLVDSLKAVPTISIVADDPSDFLVETNQNVRVETQTSIEMIYPDGTPGFQEDGGLSNFGGRFTNFRKKSFRIAFRSEFGATKVEHPLFSGFDYPNFQPVEEFDIINLRSGSHDAGERGAYMSNRFTDDTMLEMGNIAPHGRFVHVYLNGTYWGQYHLRERWNADMAASYFGGSKRGYEAINANNTGREFFNGSFDGSNVDGDVYDGSGVEWEEARRLLSTQNPFTTTANHLDIPNVIDFMLLWTSGDSESEFRAFGSPSSGTTFKFFIKDADGFLRTPNDNRNPVTHNGPLNIKTIMRNTNDPDYEILVADRINQHFFNDGALTPEKNRLRLERRVDEARLGFISEAARWGNVFRDPDSWEAFQANLINNHFRVLTDNQITKLRAAGMIPATNAPVLSQHGGSIPIGAGITMTTNATSVYYTLDGSDPRLPGGALSPSAIAATFGDGIREPEDFIESGDDWRYLADGSNQGTAWQQVNFDDSSWLSGPAQLGYGESGLGTDVGFIDTDPNTSGQQRNATTYYRQTLNIDSPGDFSEFLLTIRYDDAAAVYVNGTEVVRTSNLPANASFDTFATSPTPNESTFFQFPVSSSRFIDGENVIAVEIHNNSPGSSDTRFDLTLRGLIDLSNGSNITEAIVLNGPTEFNSRSFNSSTNEWSALTSTFFSLDSLPPESSSLVISEIHYRPAAPSTSAELAITDDRDDFEFIEIQNTSTQAVDLTGVSFNDGIDFRFADNTILEAGGFLVLVRNLEAFTARYGALPEGMIAGEYDGQLSNDGEQVILGRTGDITLQDLTYNDQEPWPLLADGQGFSMVFSGTDQSLGNSWAANSVFGGTPGQANIPRTDNFNDWSIVNGINDENSDDDNDGLSAFAEYAFGTDPFNSDNSALISSSVLSVDGQSHLAISYQQNLAATDLTFNIQESTDLQNWSDLASTILVEENIDTASQTRQVTQRLPEVLSTGPRRFLRVQVLR